MASPMYFVEIPVYPSEDPIEAEFMNLFNFKNWSVMPDETSFVVDNAFRHALMAAAVAHMRNRSTATESTGSNIVAEDNEGRRGTEMGYFKDNDDVDLEDVADTAQSGFYPDTPRAPVRHRNDNAESTVHPNAQDVLIHMLADRDREIDELKAANKKLIELLTRKSEIEKELAELMSN